MLYTAWDNLGDERVFKRGVEILRVAGIPPTHLRVYMLTGYCEGALIAFEMARIAMSSRPPSRAPLTLRCMEPRAVSTRSTEANCS